MRITERIRAGAWGFLAWLSLGQADPSGAAERAISLDEAVAFALGKNEDIFIERKFVSSANEGVRGAKGAYDPFLEVGGGWLRTKEPVNSPFAGAPPGDAPTIEIGEGQASLRQLLPTGGQVSLRAAGARETTDGSFDLLSPAYRTRAGIEFRQPLLQGLMVDPARFTIRAAKADQERSVADLRREVTEVVASVERSYWTLAAFRLAVEVGEEAIRLAEEQLSETQSRIESGAAPENEIAQPRAEVERRRGNLLAAKEDLARAETALKLLILSDDDAELWSDHLVTTDDAAVEIVPVDVAAAMERALAQRPELTAGAAIIERRRAERAFAQDQVKPSLDAVLSYDRFGLAGSRNSAMDTLNAPPVDIPPASLGEWDQSIDMLGDGDFDDARIGLVLGLPIINRTAKAGAAIARNAEQQAEADLARSRKEVRGEVLDAAATLETASQRIEAARAGREAAEVQFTDESERYDAGLSTNFLVLTRQNDLSRARLAEISALTDYRTARTEMARATGSLLDDRGIDVGEDPSKELPQ